MDTELLLLELGRTEAPFVLPSNETDIGPDAGMLLPSGIVPILGTDGDSLRVGIEADTDKPGDGLRCLSILDGDLFLCRSPID